MATDRPVFNITVKPLDTLISFVETNALSGRTEVTELNILNLMRSDEITDRHPAFYLTARADPQFEQDPGGLALRFDDPDCGFVLPAGRQLSVVPFGGVIEKIDTLFPLAPLNWDDMQAQLPLLIGLFDEAGWKRSTGRYTPNQPVREVITEADFLKSSGAKVVSVGFWEHCSTPHIKAQLEIRHFNSTLSATFIPPALLSGKSIDDGPDLFLFRIAIEVAFASTMYQEIKLLAESRRQDVSGSIETAIPLSIWLDDPHWRPEGWVGQFIE